MEMIYNVQKEGTKRKRTYCKCICDCGNEYVIEATKLQSRKNLSCGCMSQYYRSLGNRTESLIEKKINRLTILEEIYEDNKPTLVVCECECGEKLTVVRADVVNGHTQSCGCLQRESASKSNTKDFRGYVTKAGVKILRPYKQDEKHRWLWFCLCPLCGEEFVELPARVKANHVISCGCRPASYGESFIGNYLSENKIRFEKQKRFDDCKYKSTLPFDFAIYDNNNVLKMLIEYDGKQHFVPIDYFGGEDGFKLTKIRDNIKTKYCEEKNIKLLRLNYKDTDEDIISKLNKEIINIKNP